MLSTLRMAAYKRSAHDVHHTFLVVYSRTRVKEQHTGRTAERTEYPWFDQRITAAAGTAMHVCGTWLHALEGSWVACMLQPLSGRIQLAPVALHLMDCVKSRSVGACQRCLVYVVVYRLCCKSHVQ